MTKLHHLKLCFHLALGNFILILGFLACYFYSSENYSNPRAIFLFCIISLFFINFLFSSFIAKITDYKINTKRQEINFNNQINNCLDKISQSYNLIEASRISFGIYHDLSNILTSSNLILD